MKNTIENAVRSYEWSIQSIEAILDTTHQFFEGFQDFFLDTKQEREKINGELRENLAKNESLRRKDFDNMMQGILSTQDEREKEVRNLLKTYLNEQKEMARALRENLQKFKDSIGKGEAQRVKEFQAMIKEILVKQDERKDKVTSKLKEFQKEQQEMAKRLRELLTKGSELRIKDLKSMLKEFKDQHKERIARKEERREEVRSMLGEFKKERTEAARNWRTVQTKLAHKRTTFGVTAMEMKRGKTSTEEFEKAAAKRDRAKYVLRLYVTGMTPKSTQAIANVQKLCEKHLTGRYELKVIDIYQQPKLAKEEQIIATPTLIKKLPLPLRRLIGDMSDTERFLEGIGLKPKEFMSANQ